jgi:hypothetical protein
MNPGKMFDLVLRSRKSPSYRAMDERRALKTLLQP